MTPLNGWAKDWMEIEAPTNGLMPYVITIVIIAEEWTQISRERCVD